MLRVSSAWVLYRVTERCFLCLLSTASCRLKAKRTQTVDNTIWDMVLLTTAGGYVTCQYGSVSILGLLPAILYRSNSSDVC